MQLRHELEYVDPLCSTSHAPLNDRLKAIRAAQDRTLGRLGLTAIPGLVNLKG
jgi:hypothetical protein